MKSYNVSNCIFTSRLTIVENEKGGGKCTGSGKGQGWKRDPQDGGQRENYTTIAKKLAIETRRRRGSH